ncbi:pyridoxamine 5'-phosphate oxidase family protein [Aliiglaciecola sp. M165]|uniref:pyridoxamine 5'-phosphate oxidase family protein n=1 Tax=Aliiglaciecola sp. M165 TaxID=2593649 RepID=UPI0021B12254|nr:pyridoxamine 5'-phosphate oxidase family protein [Aliiglaciecola sp. M165]
MAILDRQVIASAQESVLCWLATVDSDGQPNVSPKEIFTVYHDDEIIIANIASPHSARNIKANPKVCVSFIHIFKQKGYKVYGRATYLEQKNNGYEERIAIIAQLTKGQYPVAGIFSIKVDRVSKIIAPSYSFFPNISEQEQVDSAKKTYRLK